MKLTVNLGMRPVPFQRPRRGKHGFYNDARYEQWKQDARLIIRNAMKKHGFRPTDGPVQVDVAVSVDGVTATFRTVDHNPKRPRGDLDNYTKALLDAANETVYVDDRQVVRTEAWFE